VFSDGFLGYLKDKSAFLTKTGAKVEKKRQLNCEFCVFIFPDWDQSFFIYKLIDEKTPLAGHIRRMYALPGVYSENRHSNRCDPACQTGRTHASGFHRQTSHGKSG
jgi:hypothetical protein